MKVKKSARIDKCRAEILIAAITVIEPMYKLYGQELVITSGTEKYKHKALHSHHYRGDAIDLRHRYFNDEEKREIRDSLRNDLGKHFVVLLEKTHFHVAYSPIYGV